MSELVAYASSSIFRIVVVCELDESPALQQGCWLRTESTSLFQVLADFGRFSFPFFPVPTNLHPEIGLRHHE